MDDKTLDDALKGLGDDAPADPTTPDLTAIADTAPKPKRERTTKPRATNLERRMTELFVMVGTSVIPFDATCGGSIVSQAPELGSALDALAKESPRVKKALEAMLTGGAWGGVLMASYPIILTILAHHGLLPEQSARALHVVPSKSGATDKEGDLITLAVDIAPDGNGS